MTNNSKAPTNTIVRKSTRPALVGEFHIHINAQTLSTPFEKFLIETHNFWNSDFSGHSEGLAHPPPKKHLTIKTNYES
ncbi:hypothetical protein [Nostoc sp.]